MQSRILLAAGGFWERLSGSTDIVTKQAYGYEASTGVAAEVVTARIITIFLGVLGIILVALMIYGGYVWMMARGNDEEVNRAKGLIRNAVTGIIIIMGAYAITQFVLQRILDASGI